MTHIKSLDGVRALAVLLVVLFHVGLLPFGWIGVQIFFVLSGFLITGILLTNKHLSIQHYFLRFYWRRSLRIFPLYCMFLLIAAFSFASFKQDSPWLVTYLANFARLRDTDLSPPFVHLWSLAVEEQFYLVWPFVIYFVSLRAMRHLVVAILVLAPLSRLGVYLFFHDAHPDWLGRTIYSLPTSQADAFAAGAMIALFQISRAKMWFIRLSIVTALAGAAVIAHQHLAYRSAIKFTFGYAMFLLQDGGFVWGYSLLNLTAAFGIAAIIQSPIDAFDWPPVARFGTISYGIYVYHVPLLIALDKLGLSRVILVPVYLMLIYVLSEMSYRYFEAPFLRFKKNFPESSVGAINNIPSIVD